MLDRESMTNWIDDAKRATPKTQPAEPNAQDSDETELPRWHHACTANPPKRAKPLIDGLLRCGHIMTVSAKSKCGKTWLAILLAIAIAVGSCWIGKQCKQGNVLYVDPECDPKSLDNRFREVALQVGANLSEIDKRVKILPLRGVLMPSGAPPNIFDVASLVRDCAQKEKIDLVIVDSASCFLTGDENSSQDTRRFFASVNSITESTGAAVVLILHMGKGERATWDAIERTRGSSVWGDAPDAPLSLLEIYPPDGNPSDYLAQDERAFLLEDSGLREFPSLNPVHLIYHYPVHRVDADGITDGWTPKGSPQRRTKAAIDTKRTESNERAQKCCDAITNWLLSHPNHANCLTAKDAVDIVSKAIGVNVKYETLKKYIDQSSVYEVEQISKQRWAIVPASARQGKLAVN